MKLNIFKIETDDEHNNNPYDTIGRRIIAGWLDNIIYSLLHVILSLIFFFGIGKNGYIFVSIIYPFGYVLYNILTVKVLGGSFGKIQCGLLILTADNETEVAWSQSIRREIIGIISIGIAVTNIILFISTSSEFSYTAFQEFQEEHIISSISEGIMRFIGVIEIITALTNSRRRALHDFIGGTVVKKAGKMKKGMILVSIIGFAFSIFLYSRIITLFN